MKKLITLLTLALFAFSSYSQCADTITVQAGKLQFTWTTNPAPTVLDSVNFKGTWYPGMIVGGSKWRTTANTFTAADLVGNYTVIMGTDTCVGSNGALPVEMLYFNASISDNGIHLTWATASELHNSHFELERSYNGTTWEVIEHIMGSGTTVNIHSYQTYDKTAKEGFIYYRLKQVDFNGEFEYHSTIVIKNVSSSDIRLEYTEDYAIVKLNINLYQATVYMYRVDGSLISTQVITDELILNKSYDVFIVKVVTPFNQKSFKL